MKREANTPRFRKMTARDLARVTRLVREYYAFDKLPFDAAHTRAALRLLLLRTAPHPHPPAPSPIPANGAGKERGKRTQGRRLAFTCGGIRSVEQRQPPLVAQPLPFPRLLGKVAEGRIEVLRARDGLLPGQAHVEIAHSRCSIDLAEAQRSSEVPTPPIFAGATRIFRRHLSL